MLGKAMAMIGKNIVRLLTILACLILLIPPCYAQKPMLLEIESRHENYDGPGDPVGEQVVDHLKKLIAKSDSLKLTSEQEPRLKLIIQTFDPLSQKVHLFTVFSFIFVYMDKPNMVPIYVMSAMGYAHRDDVAQAAEQLNTKVHMIARNIMKSLEAKH